MTFEGQQLSLLLPQRGVSCLRLVVMLGATKRLVLIGPEALRVFRGVFFRRNSSPSNTSYEWNKGEREKGEFLSC